MVTTANTTEADQDWVKQRMYWKLNALEAAQDPRTPEDHLMRSGFHNLAWYQACTARDPMTTKLSGWLIALASSWPGDSGDHAAAIVAATTMSRCASTDQLLRLARGIRPGGSDWTGAVSALAAHPSSSDEVVAWALVAVMDHPSDGPEQAAAAAGSFVPYARRLSHQARTMGRTQVADAHLSRTPAELAHELIDVAASINVLFPDPQLRRVAARVSLTFNGSPTELVHAVQVATAA